MPRQLITICVGTRPDRRIYERVLKFSITRRTKGNVQFIDMEGPAWQPAVRSGLGDGFAFRRFLIPDYLNFVGKAIYTDVESLCFGDVEDLWNLIGESSGVSQLWVGEPDYIATKTPTRATATAVWDCEACKRWAPSRVIDQLTHRVLGQDDAFRLQWLLEPPQPLADRRWCVCDEYRNGDIKLLHYHSRISQPARDPGHPLAGLWEAELKEAIRSGAITKTMFETELDAWTGPDFSTYRGLNPQYKSLLRLF